MTTPEPPGQKKKALTAELQLRIEGQDIRNQPPGRNRTMTIIAPTEDVMHSVSPERRLALSGTLPANPVTYIACEDDGFGYHTLERLHVDSGDATAWVEVVRNSDEDQWTLDLVNVTSPGGGITPDQASRVARLIYAAGKQAELLNQGLSPALAVIVGRALTAGTR